MVEPTTSLDLPASLRELLQLGSPLGGDMEVYKQPMPGAQRPVYGFADGGMVGPTGAPMPQQGMMPTMAAQMPQQGGLQEMQVPASVATMNDIQTFIAANPEMVQQIQQAVQEELQTGEVDEQELNVAVEMASIALQDPSMYPQVREAMVRQGMLDEGDLPADPQAGMFILYTVVITAQAMQGVDVGGMPAQEAMSMQGEQLGQPEMQNFADGGYVKPYDNAKDGGKVVGPGTGTSDSIPINVSAGEYVIPAHIVQAKGKEFFDSMLNKYRR